VLRRELNNPLIGILGNAELLLSEIRRNDDGRLPAGGLQRLETIAALALRLRETIRRLSQSGKYGTPYREKNRAINLEGLALQSELSQIRDTQPLSP
jgi:signal transduction histidine kinase